MATTTDHDLTAPKASCLHYGERVSGNIFIRPSGILAAGKTMPRHRHNFDHTTIVFSGAIRIVPDGGEAVELRAPAEYLVLASVEHEITALEDGTVYWCVYSHRSAQGEVVQAPDSERAYF